MALPWSVVTSDFIWESTSSSCEGGSVLSVREIESGQVRPGGRSIPWGKGGNVLAPFGGAMPGGGMGTPFRGRGGC